MNWIKKHDGWLKPQSADTGARRTMPEKPVLTVAEAALELGVDKQTVRKYLALDPDDEAPIPFNAWYRLPGGHIRIYKYIVIEIKGGEYG